MNFTIVCDSGVRSRLIACALMSVLMPLVARATDWQMSGNDLTNDRNQPHETLIVYAGAMDPKGYMRAFDAATGRILCRMRQSSDGG